MKTPKMLPWLARRHGVSDDRAEELWADALRHATAETGWVGNSDYWKAAVAHLIESLKAESLYRPPIARFVRASNRFGAIPFIVWQGLAKIAAAALNRFHQPAHSA